MEKNHKTIVAIQILNLARMITNNFFQKTLFVALIQKKARPLYCYLHAIKRRLNQDSRQESKNAAERTPVLGMFAGDQPGRASQCP